MDIIAEKLKDVCVLKLNGQLDSKTSLELEDEILKIFDTIDTEKRGGTRDRAMLET